MKKILIIMLTVLCFASCVKLEDKIRLQNEYTELSSEVAALKDKKNELTTEINQLDNAGRALGAGHEVHYIVKLKIKQGTFTLDPFEHIKNEMNAIEMELPVSRDYYNTLKVGQDLSNSFKWGSLVMNGDFSHLHVKVTGKRID